jgi:ribosomal-protein-alanine acetyltransferase
MEFIIKPFKSEDVEKVAELKEFFEEMWDEAALLSELSNAASIAVLAKNGQQVIGFCAFSAVKEEANLNMILVHPKYRKNGVGEIMLKEAVKKIKEKGATEAYLEVRVSNEAAINLYQKFRFEQVGLRKNFYKNPEDDALIMHCYL